MWFVVFRQSLLVTCPVRPSARFTSLIWLEGNILCNANTCELCTVMLLQSVVVPDCVGTYTYIHIFISMYALCNLYMYVYIFSGNLLVFYCESCNLIGLSYSLSHSQ